MHPSGTLRRYHSLVLVIALASVIFASHGLGQQASGKGGTRRGSGLGAYEKPPPANDVPQEPYNIILGRPTDTSITIRVLTSARGKGFVQYRPESQTVENTTPVVNLAAGEPRDILLDGLIPNAGYVYHFHWQPNGSELTERSTEYRFHTQRSHGQPFTFTVQADSHLDENSSGAVYLRTLANTLADQPDFHFELGDTFMTGKYVRPELALGQYLAQRYYLGHLCHSAPLFFALGNHDGEVNGRGSIAWASQTRKKYFPNPFPGNFYSGNVHKEPGVGYPEDYYAWEWGDAQFLVLDPFRYSTRRGRGGANAVGDNWSWSLGTDQYQWLKRTLTRSHAAFRFVFLHHLVGGSVPHSRGGAEVAMLWEWGGKNAAGDFEFDKHRPGWGQPIHDLLKEHGVCIVFHGHDHLFAKQDMDGIVYQEVPQPSHARLGNTRSASEYGYLAGEIQPSSGYVRVRVEPGELRVDYVRTYLETNESATRRNGEVSYSYRIPCTRGAGASP